MFHDLSKSVCASKNYLTLSFLNMITGYNELKKLLKHKSYNCKCNFNGRKCYSNQNSSNNK